MNIIKQIHDRESRIDPESKSRQYKMAWITTISITLATVLWILYTSNDTTHTSKTNLHLPQNLSSSDMVRISTFAGFEILRNSSGNFNVTNEVNPYAAVWIKVLSVLNSN